MGLRKRCSAASRAGIPAAAASLAAASLEAMPPVPTLIVKAAVPLLCGMLGDVPNPEMIVGAVEFNNRLVVERPAVEMPPEVERPELPMVTAPLTGIVTCPPSPRVSVPVLPTTSG